MFFFIVFGSEVHHFPFLLHIFHAHSPHARPGIVLQTVPAMHFAELVVGSEPAALPNLCVNDIWVLQWTGTRTFIFQNQRPKCGPGKRNAEYRHQILTFLCYIS